MRNHRSRSAGRRRSRRYSDDESSRSMSSDVKGKRRKRQKRKEEEKKKRMSRFIRIDNLTTNINEVKLNYYNILLYIVIYITITI